MSTDTSDKLSGPWWLGVQSEFQLSEKQLDTLRALVERQIAMGGIQDKPKAVQISNRRAFERIAANLRRAHAELSALDFDALQYLADYTRFSESEPHIVCDARMGQVTFRTSLIPGDYEPDLDEFLFLISELGAIAARGAGIKGTPLNEDYSLDNWVLTLARFWRATCKRKYTRSFHKSEPTNEPSHFTVKMTQAVDPTTSTSRIELAMKRHRQAASKFSG
ncbi:hypothetical protein [Planktotalea arctica]|uniref:hypothetical protein n=1 Tax=Planktotalea arctica TaxID=1481893 RepID=UPI0023B52261